MNDGDDVYIALSGWEPAGHSESSGGRAGANRTSGAAKRTRAPEQNQKAVSTAVFSCYLCKTRVVMGVKLCG